MKIKVIWPPNCYLRYSNSRRYRITSKAPTSAAYFFNRTLFSFCRECIALFSYALRTVQPKTIMFFLRVSCSFFLPLCLYGISRTIFANKRDHRSPICAHSAPDHFFLVEHRTIDLLSAADSYVQRACVLAANTMSQYLMHFRAFVLLDTKSFVWQFFLHIFHFWFVNWFYEKDRNCFIEFCRMIFWQKSTMGPECNVFQPSTLQRLGCTKNAIAK